MYYNKWVQGIAGREFGTQRIKFKDIVKANDEHDNQNPNTVRSLPPLPYPLPNAVSIFGDLIINMSNALTMFKTALKNPAIEKNIQAKEEITEAATAIKRALSELNHYFAKTKEKVEKTPE